MLIPIISKVYGAKNNTGTTSSLRTGQRIFPVKRKYIFVISHMRSRSSLLAHILGSHQDITGYMEMHQSYRGRFDLLKLNYRLLKYSEHTPYVLDKIISNKHTINNKILLRNDVMCLFLLRKPDDTFRSMINLGYLTGIKWYMEPQLILEYYKSRLKKMEEYAFYKEGKGLYINSDKLISESFNVLKRISKFLQLDDALKKEYKIFENTGVPGLGDPSESIKRGVIITNHQELLKKIVIPESIINEAYCSYYSCKNILNKQCIHT